MQCPSCDHVAAAEAFGEPAKCPSCGVYYHKALAHKERLERQAKEIEFEPDPEISEPGIGEKLKHGLEGAMKAVEDGRRERLQQELATKAVLSRSTPSAVAVVDLQMPFWSMVWFMVKWAIASIPALIILGFILVAVVSFVSGFTSSIGRVPGT